MAMGGASAGAIGNGVQSYLNGLGGSYGPPEPQYSANPYADAVGGVMGGLPYGAFQGAQALGYTGPGYGDEYNLAFEDLPYGGY